MAGNCYWFVYIAQSALGYDYQASLSKHQSQTDAAKGFGGKYGVDKDNQDAVSRGSIVYIVHEDFEP